MQKLIQRIFSEGTTPIMSDEGLFKVFQFYYERCLKRLPLYRGQDYNGGPSRSIRLSTSKQRIDDMNFNEEAVKTFVNSEIRRLYGSSYCGNITEDFPFGRFKNGNSGAEYDTRIYINAPFGKVRYDFVLLYAKKCKERGIPCGAKFFEKDSTSAAIDNMVLYSSHENLITNLEILEEIHRELPEFAECCGSPIASGLNYSYYAIAHYGDAMSTYNGWFNNLSSRAFCITLSKLISEDSAFYNSLTDNEKRVVEIMANSASLIKKSEVKKVNTIIPKEFQGIDLGKNGAETIKKIFEKFLATNPRLKEKEITQKFKDEIKTIASLSNFGDTKHKNMPISLRESDYLTLGISPEEIIKDKSANKTIKKPYSRERISKIMTIDEQKLKIEVMLAGYSFADVDGKGKVELREMLFDKITLDRESMISILCGGEVQLKQFLLYFGATAEDISSKSREELEEMFINKFGLDEIIKASEEVKQQENISGKKRNHRYENVLSAMRLNRGKTIIESEQYKNLKTKEEKVNYLSSLSLTELEDAESYYTNKQNVQKFAEDTMSILF